MTRRRGFWRHETTRKKDQRMNWALAIDKSDIARAQLAALDPAPLEQGQIRLAVRRFALTANNITYAAFGTAMGYWDFFPADGDTGRLPVWGFADIAESRAEGLEPGERIYGYFPAASELVATPERITPGGFIDAAAHRAGLPGAYNRYVRCAGDPAYRRELEAVQMVLQPLFITSFLIDLHLRDENFSGAGAVSLTSASSKTALALAWLLSRDHPEGVMIEALTSARNREFVAGTGFHDQVTVYDDVKALEPEPRRLIIDFAGDRDLTTAIHARLGDALAGNIRVGGAHWEKSAPPGALPGPKPRFFFAPDHAQSRIKAWGPAVFQHRYQDAWAQFAELGRTLFTEQIVSGGEGTLEGYRALVAGNAPASQALSVRV